MTTRTITVTKRDGTTKSVETPYSDDAALARLEALVTPQPVAGSASPNAHMLARSEFACDLVRKGRRYGLSPKQSAWVHILVVEAETQREAPTASAPLPRLRAMIDKAAMTLRYPKVNFTTEQGARIRLSRAGDRARTPGVVNITDGKPYGESVLYGRIDIDGMLIPARGMTDDVQAFLVAFDADPAATAKAYGLRTGNCCFCNRELTDGRSVAMGYGPVCAGHYSLPWGDDRVASTVDVGGDAWQRGSPEQLAEFHADMNDPESPEARAAGLG